MHTLIEKSRARSSWYCGLALSAGFMLYIGLTFLHRSPSCTELSKKIIMTMNCPSVQQRFVCVLVSLLESVILPEYVSCTLRKIHGNE